MRAAYDRGRENVRRDLIERGGEPQDVVGVHRAGGHDLGNRRSADRDRAGLVEQEDLATRQPLEGGAALHDDAATRGARQARDDRDRRGKDQRTRRGNDEDRDGAHEIAGDRPGAPRQDQAHEQERARVPIRESNERRARRLGCRNEADDACVGAFARRRGGAQVERSAGIDHATAHRVADAVLDRQRFTRQRALVEDDVVGFGQPVDRHHFARLDQQEIPGANIVERRRRQAAVDVPVDDPWCALQQRAQLPTRERRRSGLERPPAREHHRDDRAGQILVHDQSADECEHGDRVDADPAVSSGIDHPPRRGRQADDRRSRPHRIPEVR